MTQQVVKAELPKLADIYDEKQIELSYKVEQLNFILCQNPNPQWIKKHPYIKDHNYLPIDKVEFLLRKIFKRYKIEVIESGMILNSVHVHVRVHYVDPVTGEWMFHDGDSAQEIQTKSGSGPLKLDMTNINNGAVPMALGIAKSIAIKDACDHFGDLFGANLNRRDVQNFSPDKALDKEQQLKDLSELYQLKKENVVPDEQINIERIIQQKEHRSYKKAMLLLSKL